MGTCKNGQPPPGVGPGQPSALGVRAAEILSAQDLCHLSRAAKIIMGGGIIGFPFNGVFGLFGDADHPEAAAAIFAAKNRPNDKNLILVCPPEHVGEFCDLARLATPPDKLTLQRHFGVGADLHRWAGRRGGSERVDESLPDPLSDPEAVPDVRGVPFAESAGHLA